MPPQFLTLCILGSVANVAKPEKIISGLVLKALFTTFIHMPVNASQSNLPKDSLTGALNH